MHGRPTVGFAGDGEMWREIDSNGSPGLAGAVLVIGCLAIVLGLSGIEFAARIDFVRIAPIKFLIDFWNSNTELPAPAETHFDSFSEARGGVVKMVATVESYYDGEHYLFNQEVPIAAAHIDEVVRAISKAEPDLTNPSRQFVGSLDVRFADGSRAHMELSYPIGDFEWRRQWYRGDLSVVEETLSRAAKESAESVAPPDENAPAARQ